MLEWLVDNLVLIGLVLVGLLVLGGAIVVWIKVHRINFYIKKDETEVRHDDISIEEESEFYGHIETESMPSPRMISELEPGRVEFAVFAPKNIVRKSVFILDVWAYLPDQYKSALMLAKELNRDALLGKKHGLELERGSTLLIAVEIESLEISDSVDTFVWNGFPTNSSFTVKVPSNIQLGQHPGKVTVTYEGMVISKIPFIIETNVADEDKNYEKKSSEAFYPNTAFASYSRENRDEVLSRIHGMKKIAPNLDVFLDVFTLRSGQDWQKKLEEHVPTKDVFYLFWSQFAAKSEWVDREWRLALNKRGLGYIEPVPLEDIEQAPPPSELKSLHFNDLYVAYIQYERLKKAATKPRTTNVGQA